MIALTCLLMFLSWTGDKEKELGLPISPLCDRDTVKKADSQIGFLKFVVRPTYLLLGAILPKVNDVVMPIIDEQIAYWVQKKAKINQHTYLESKT